MRHPFFYVRRPILQMRGVLALPWKSRLLAVEAYVELALARSALALFSFSRIAKTLGKTVRGDVPPGATQPTLQPRQYEEVRRLAWILPRVARGAVFTANCLPQAIAARRMLQRRGIASVLHIGVAKANRGAALNAHAWLEADAMDVTGSSTAAEFTEIARIV